MASVIIAGAGLTGLSASYHLERQHFSDFSILEKESVAGGLLRSHTQNGFTFDYTGHLLHIGDPYFKAFIEDVAGLTSFDYVQRKTFVYSHNMFTAYPFQSNLYGLPTEVIIECIEGFINRKKRMHNPDNFYEWVLKHFGEGFAKHFFVPYNEKILAYPIKKVHHSWTGRFVPSTTLKDLLKGALKPRDVDASGYNSSFYYPHKGGIQFLIECIKKNIAAQARTTTPITEVNVSTKTITTYDGKKENYSALISTMPLDELLGIITGPGSERLRALKEKLLCNSVLNFNIGFKNPPDLDKHWIYYPEKKYPFYRLGFWHSISSTAVPEGHGALYGELSFHPSQKKIDTTSLLENAITQALDLFNIKESDIVIRKNLLLKHAYVTYDQWREKNIAAIHQELNNLNIYSTGRFGGWKYSSMQEAVLDGKDVATAVLKKLRHESPERFVDAFNTPSKTSLRQI